MDASVSLDRIKSLNIFWALGADRYKVDDATIQRLSHLCFWSGNVQKFNSKEML